MDEYISRAVGCTFLSLKYYLFGICYIEGKKIFYCVKPLSLTRKITIELLATMEVSKLNMLQAEMPLQELLDLHK